nr:hypothetical protein [Tanacetum cinerariifolium]
MVNAKVDGWNPKMTDDTATVKSGHAFVQGISVALNNAAELVEIILVKDSKSNKLRALQLFPSFPFQQFDILCYQWGIIPVNSGYPWTFI